MSRLVNAINETLWGEPMLILLIGCGIYLSIRLGFLQVRRVKEWLFCTLSSMFKKREDTDTGITPYQALSSALASTIGSGNIVGVATAIASGGAGAVFWMWVSAFFGMATKYTEIYLALKFRKRKGDSFFGGPMYYIENGLGKGFSWLAYVFAFSGAIACIGMGSMNQANSISQVMTKALPISETAVGITLFVLAALGISGGIKKISKVTEKLVPIMAILYIGTGVLIIFLNIKSVPSAFSLIIRSAFSPNAVYGALGGEMMRRSVRFGVARGVFSNEAGLGTSPIVHAAANAESPDKQGLWGIFEVFITTIVICTITAIVVICGKNIPETETGVRLVSAAFSGHIGKVGGFVVEISTILFAFTTILGWSYYGETCIAYIFREKELCSKIYRTIFAFSVIFGATQRTESVWALSDMFNGVMIVPNLIAVILLSGIVIRENKEKRSL